MTKDEVAEHLTNAGYPASNEKGVVTIKTAVPMPKTKKNKIRRILREIGYRASWGWRLEK